MKSRRFRTLHFAANAGESRENTGILVRSFSSVPGTRGRKWTAATGEGTAGDTLHDFTPDVQALELLLVASR